MIREEYGADHFQMEFDVGEFQNGIRLDAFLKNYYRRRSREALKRAIWDGSVWVERTQGTHYSLGKLKPASQLLKGDRVLVRSERKPEPPVDFNYGVIYEDEELLVVDKPANLPVHPAGRYFFNTLLVHLRTEGHQHPLRAEREFYLPHRIDKETSGVLVLAKDREVCAGIVEQFAERTTQKKYLAIVHGITPESFSVSAPVRRSPTAIVGLKMETCRDTDADALSAHTDFKRLESHGRFSLVECFPKTGRQHQIRVHLDSVGHAIVGDKLYGRPENEAFKFYERERLTPENWEALLLPRHALHAAELSFRDPRNKKMVTFKSDLPKDLRDFLRQKDSSNAHRSELSSAPVDGPAFR